MSNNYATMLLSKVIDTESIHTFTKHNIHADSFISSVDRQVYEFITDYAEKNRGEMPSYATVVTEIPDFDYVPGVTDGFEYLASKIRQRRAEYDFKLFVENKLPSLYEEVGKKDMAEMTDILTEEMADIHRKVQSGAKVGFDIKNDTDSFKAEYKRRQLGESFKVWKSHYPTINRVTSGGYASGNMYTIYGKSGRGKSVIATTEAANLAIQGANVLIWSMEMAEYETLTRIYTYISAMLGKTTAMIDGAKYDAGFDSSGIRNGQLTEDMEREFFRMLDEVNGLIDGTIIVRGVDDPSFSKRDLTQLRHDIEETQADVVVIDPFYYLDYEANTSKTAGGDAANTSQKLRRLAGSTSTVVFAITQADETESTEDGEGNRELKPPARKDVKKTKQLLEDAALLIGVDTDYKQNLGMISLGKGRDGGEGEVAELLYVPSVGIVKEIVFDANMFGF